MADSAPSNPRGTFVVLEGLDRSGKTTQAKLLEQRFAEEGRPVKTMRFPDRTTTIGQMIDGYLRSSTQLDDHAIHLLFSANRWEAVSTIKQTLAAGTSIICDRYYHSGVVYSAAKQNPSLSFSWARGPDVGLPRPDVVVFLDLSEEKAQKRGGWGGEVYEKAEMQRRVKDLFQGLSKGDSRDPQAAEDIVVVDAGGSVTEVADSVWHRVRERMELVNQGVLGRSVRVLEE